MMCDAKRVNALTMRMSRLGTSLSGSVICITSSSGMPLNLSIFRFFFTTDMWSVIISCFSAGFSSVVLLGSQCNQQINKKANKYIHNVHYCYSLSLSLSIYLCKIKFSSSSSLFLSLFLFFSVSQNSKQNQHSK